MKIKVTYINTNDPYSKLYEMSKSELIEIIKTDDKIIDKLNNR